MRYFKAGGNLHANDIQLIEYIIKGMSLLQIYDGSLPKLLMDTYLGGSWEVWLFDPLPDEYWNIPLHRRQDFLPNYRVTASFARKYFDWIAEKLKIDRMEEWYTVSLAMHSNIKWFKHIVMVSMIHDCQQSHSI
jgi:hypothetical protein